MKQRQLFWLQDLGNLLDNIASCDLFTDAPESQEQVREIREQVKAWREVLIVEGLVK